MRFIELTNSDYKAIVDDKIYDLVISCGPWCVVYRHGRAMAISSTRKILDSEGKKYLILARFVLGLINKSSRIFADHIHGNIYDNREDFLRKCSNQQNLYNRRKGPDNKSGHKNISYSKTNDKWRVTLVAKSKRIHVGYYETIDEAIIERDKALIEHHKQFARLC